MALIACGLIAYSSIALLHLRQPDDPRDDDQLPFLERAAEVHASGGPTALIRDLYAGSFPEANRHPLYIGLLSLYPTHTFGRRLSATLGLLTLMVLTALTSRSRGMFIGGLFCVLLGANRAFALLTTRTVCDGLLVLWCGLVFLLAPARSNWRQALIGVLLGLAWLTKGTGLLLLAGYVAWVLLDGFFNRWTCETDAVGRSSKAILLDLMITLLAWAAIASPLLVRNVRLFGSPTHNVTSWLLFVDTYENPILLSQRSSIGEAARDYLTTHSAADIVQRETSGLAWETFILLRILGPWPLQDSRVLVGLVLGIGAIIAIVARPRREHGLLAVWIAILVPMFAWYIPIAAGDRFPLPLLAPLLICAAGGTARLLVVWRQK